MKEVQRQNIELKGEMDNLWLRVYISRQDKVGKSGFGYPSSAIYNLLEKLAVAMDFTFNIATTSTPSERMIRDLHCSLFSSSAGSGAWPDIPIGLYVNDHLTPYCKSLFYESRIQEAHLRLEDRICNDLALQSVCQGDSRLGT